MMKTLSTLAFLAAAVALTPAHAYVVTNTGGVVTSEAGATTFANFDGLALTGIGTVSGGIINNGANPGGGGDWLSAQGPGPDITVTLTGLSDYIGFLWGTNDGAFNLVDMELVSGNVQIATISGNSITAFTNIFASNASEYFDRVVLSMSLGSCCFEVDNFAARLNVNAVPEPAPFALVGLGLVGLALSRRRQA